jgi:perosamine synthetase
MISLAAVKLSQEVEDAVVRVIREGAIGQSEYIEQFEAALCAFTGAKYAIAVSSGSMADTVLLAACKEYYQCKQVIVPALTFIAQPNAVRVNGLEVIFCDIKDNGLIDDSQFDSILTDDNPAIVFSCDLMGRIPSIEKNSFPVIEDACEAFGSINAGRHGIAGTFSFYPSHVMSTGEGGAIITDNLRIAELCRSIRNHGRAQEFTTEAPFNKFHFERFGYNAKMSGIHAAIGLAQMTTIEEKIERRKEIYSIFCQELNERHYAGTCPHGMPVQFTGEYARDRAMIILTSAEIECRQLFSCIPYREPYYMARRRNKESFPIAAQLADTTLYIPCHQNLTDEEISHIIYTVKRLPDRVNKQGGSI